MYSRLDSSVLHSWKWPWVSDPPASTSKVWIADFYLHCHVQFMWYWNSNPGLLGCESSPLPSYISSTNAGRLSCPSFLYVMYELVMCVHVWRQGADFNCFPWLLSTLLFYLSIYFWGRVFEWIWNLPIWLGRPARPPMHCKGLPMSIRPVLRLHTHPSFHLSTAHRPPLLPVITTLLTKLSAQSPETVFLTYDFILLSKV